MLAQLAMMAASAVPPPSPSPPPPSPSVPPGLLDASKCPNERHDLCGALGSGDEKIRNGDRVVNAEGKILCFTAAGDIQLGRDGTPVLQSLGLSGSGAVLVMQSDGNLVYRDANGRAKWAFNNAVGAPTSGCPDSTSCFLEFALPSACVWPYGAGKDCTGVKRCPPPPPPPPEPYRLPLGACCTLVERWAAPQTSCEFCRFGHRFEPVWNCGGSRRCDWSEWE